MQADAGEEGRVVRGRLPHAAHRDCGWWKCCRVSGVWQPEGLHSRDIACTGAFARAVPVGIVNRLAEIYRMVETRVAVVEEGVSGSGARHASVHVTVCVFRLPCLGVCCMLFSLCL